MGGTRMALARRSRARDPIAVRSMIDRFFEDPMFPTGWWGNGIERMAAAEAVPLDIFEEGDAIVVRASLPGVKPDDLHVEMVGDELHIRGETREETERDEDSYYLREHRYGRFERRVMLPQSVSTDDARAEFDDGVLTLTLPKTAEAKGRTIEVRKGMDE